MTTPNYYVKAYHNILRAHGRSVQILRQKVEGVQIGAAPAIYPYVPKTAADREVCRNTLFSTKRVMDGKPNNPIEMFFNVPSMFLDPIVFGKYPEDGLEVIEKYLPSGWQEDMALISQPIDFIAFNTYQGAVASENPDGSIHLETKPVGYARTAIDWPVNPEVLYWVATFLYERYKMPMYVSENGLSSMDWVALDGKVHDAGRIDYLQRHLLQLEKAIDEGVDMRGYFQWSLMDNFEWARGYYDRFGLIYVDYATGNGIYVNSGVTLVVSGGSVESTVYMHASGNVTLSGAAKMSDLNVTKGAMITLGALTEGAEIFVTATAGNVITVANAEIATLKNYIKPIDVAAMTFEVTTDNTLKAVAVTAG